MDIYTHLRAFEADYDRAQGGIRNTASLWILAAFAAFSYALSTQSLPNGITHASLVVVIGWAAAFGLLILWISDQLVYQKLLHSVFVHGLYLEWRDASLPQIRTKAYFDSLNVSFKLSLFYIAPTAAFLIVELYIAVFSGPFLIPPTTVQSHVRWDTSDDVLIVLLAMHLGALLYMCYASGRDRDLLKQHGRPYPPEFLRYLRDKRYKRTLEERLAKPGEALQEPQ